MLESWFRQDTHKAVQVRYLDGNVFSADNNGNKVGVELYNGNSPVNISGSISANIIRKIDHKGIYFVIFFNFSSFHQDECY